MSGQDRLAALIAAIGADVKALTTHEASPAHTHREHLVTHDGTDWRYEGEIANTTRPANIPAYPLAYIHFKSVDQISVTEAPVYKQDGDEWTYHPDAAVPSAPDSLEARVAVVETELGTNPSGGSATVGVRIEAVEGALASYQALSQKGAVDGYAPLGSDAKVPSAYLPAASGGSGGTDLGWVNILDHGAVATNAATATDCYAAIIAARDAAGIGGTVYIPSHGWGGGASGVAYWISQTIEPLRSQTWVFDHTPQYDSDEYFLGTAIIRAKTTFTGGAMFQFNSAINNVDVTFVNAAIQGRGEAHATRLDGWHGGSNTSSTERNWKFHNVQASALSGAAFSGHMLAWEADSVWFLRNGYGIRPNGATEAALDFKLTGNCVIAWNVLGGIVFNSALQSGGVTLAGVIRVERNGVTPATNALANRTPAARGIDLSNVRQVQLSGIYTDGNAGVGLWIEPDVGQSVYSVIGSDITLVRDGGGDLAMPDTMHLPGFHIKDARGVDLTLAVEMGDPSDSATAGTGEYPYYGVESDYAYDSFIRVTRNYQKDPTRWFNVSNNNDGTYIIHPPSGRFGPAYAVQPRTADYTLEINDANRVVEHNSGTAHTFTIPPNDTTNANINLRFVWPVGTKIDLVNLGAGDLSIAPGSGVTLVSKGGNRKLDGQYAAGTLYCRGTNSWVLIGALKA